MIFRVSVNLPGGICPLFYTLFIFRSGNQLKTAKKMDLVQKDWRYGLCYPVPISIIGSIPNLGYCRPPDFNLCGLDPKSTFVAARHTVSLHSVWTKVHKVHIFLVVSPLKKKHIFAGKIHHFSGWPSAPGKVLAAPWGRSCESWCCPMPTVAWHLRCWLKKQGQVEGLVLVS